MLPTKQLYVFYVLHQQVHFISHVTREDNLWRRASSAATQRLTCYTRWRQSALSAFLKLVRQILRCVCVCVCKDSPLTSSNGSNQFLTANKLHPHYEDKNSYVFVSFGRCSEDWCHSGFNNGVACYDVSEERAAAETCTWTKFGCPEDAVGIFFRKGGTLQGVQMQKTATISAKTLTVLGVHTEHTNRPRRKWAVVHIVTSVIYRLTQYQSRVHVKVLTDREVRPKPWTDMCPYWSSIYGCQQEWALMGLYCNRTNHTDAGNTGNKETLVTTVITHLKSVSSSDHFYPISHLTLLDTSH